MIQYVIVIKTNCAADAKTVPPTKRRVLKIVKSTKGCFLKRAITGINDAIDDHEGRIVELETNPPSCDVCEDNNETFPEYLNYLGSSDRKKIVCGYGETHRLDHIEALGYTCDFTYKTYSSGREKVSCRCKKL